MGVLALNLFQNGNMEHLNIDNGYTKAKGTIHCLFKKLKLQP